MSEPVSVSVIEETLNQFLKSVEHMESFSVDDAVLTKGYNAFWIPRLDLVRWSTIRSITGVRFRITMPEGQNECTVYCTGVYTVN